MKHTEEQRRKWREAKQRRRRAERPVMIGNPHDWSTVHVDPVKGSDKNAGSREAPLKTFEEYTRRFAKSSKKTTALYEPRSPDVFTVDDMPTPPVNPIVAAFEREAAAILKRHYENRK